jgi:hypothetical protein
MADAEAWQSGPCFRVEHQRLNLADLDDVGRYAIDFRWHQVALADRELRTLLLHQHHDRVRLGRLARLDFMALRHADDPIEREQPGFVQLAGLRDASDRLELRRLQARFGTASGEKILPRLGRSLCALAPRSRPFSQLHRHDSSLFSKGRIGAVWYADLRTVAPRPIGLGIENHLPTVDHRGNE